MTSPNLPLNKSFFRECQRSSQVVSDRRSDHVIKG